LRSRSIAVVVVTALDDDGFVAITIPVFTLADHLTVAITVAMSGTDGDTDTTGTDPDADFLSASRHRQRNSRHRDGSHHKTFDHRMFVQRNYQESNSRQYEAFRVAASGKPRKPFPRAIRFRDRGHVSTVPVAWR